MTSSNFCPHHRQAWGRLQIDDYDYKEFLKGDFDYDYTKLEVADYNYSTIRPAFHVRVFPPHGDPDPGHRAESAFPYVRGGMHFTARGIPAPSHCKSYTLEDVFLWIHGAVASAGDAGGWSRRSVESRHHTRPTEADEEEEICHTFLAQIWSRYWGVDWSYRPGFGLTRSRYQLLHLVMWQDYDVPWHGCGLCTAQGNQSEKREYRKRGQST